MFSLSQLLEVLAGYDFSALAGFVPPRWTLACTRNPDTAIYPSNMPFRHPDSVHHVFGTRTSEPKHNSRPRRVCWGTEMMAKFTLLTSSIELVILVDFMPGLSAPPKQRSISVHCHVSIIRKLRTASDARFVSGFVVIQGKGEVYMQSMSP